MANLTYEVPTVGEKVTAAVPKVNTALTEIKTQVNGKITTANLEASGVTGPKLGIETLRLLAGNKWEAIKSYTKAEAQAGVEISASRPALVSYENATSLTIGGVEMLNSSGIYLVAAGEKWEANHEPVRAQWRIL